MNKKLEQKIKKLFLIIVLLIPISIAILTGYAEYGKDEIKYVLGDAIFMFFVSALIGLFITISIAMDMASRVAPNSQGYWDE